MSHGMMVEMVVVVEVAVVLGLVSMILVVVTVTRVFLEEDEKSRLVEEKTCDRE